MTYFLTSFVSYYIASFALGMIWYFFLFKDKYQKITGGFALENPIFAIGFTSLTIFAITIIAVFNFAFPLIGQSFGGALIIMLVMWIPHFVCTMGTAAKYDIADRRSWLLYELGFVGVNVFVLSAVLQIVFVTMK